jgi:hypothetical protein
MSVPVCGNCGSSKFRTSQLRSSDIGKLLRLRYPIRCRICSERDFTFIGTALSFGRKNRKKTDTIASGRQA